MKKYLPAVIAAVVVGAAGFWGGSQYAKSAAPSASQQTASLAGQFRRFGAGAGGGQSDNLVAGQIIAEDAQSITVGLRGGSGSKIVFLSPSTRIFKIEPGGVSDLKTGAQVAVTGTANSDGSIAASDIQLRPDFATTTAP